MSIYDGLKDAASILKESGKIEQYRQILDAQEKMLEMQKRIADLEKENADLKDKLKIKANLKLKNDAYWTIDSGDGHFARVVGMRKISQSDFIREGIQPIIIVRIVNAGL